MNKIKIYLIAGSILGITSCSKYLDQEPDNRATLTSPQKVSELLATAYPQASYLAFNEALSDNVSDKGSGDIDNSNLDPYFFNDVRDNAQDTPDNFWNAAYQAVAAANQALEVCDKVTNPEAYKAQRGEALVCRAFAHFLLVTLYSKPYDVATAASNPGIPYVTEPETVVIKQYSRGTVASVYTQIEKDLAEGLPLIDDKGYAVPRYHFNRSAANAFAARFYLYKKQYDSVLKYATASVPDFLPNLRPWNTDYTKFNLNELPLEYQRPTQAANLLLVSCPSNYAINYAYATYRYALVSSIEQEILGFPLLVTGGSWAYQTGTVGSQSNVNIAKLHMRDFAYETPTSDFGTPYGTICLLTVEEVLFNKAEANVYLGNYDAAIADLNLYLSTRLTSVTPGSLPSNNRITQSRVLAVYGSGNGIKNGLINLILDYKRAEYVQEGMRWFDILRYGIEVTHVFLGSGGNVIDTKILTADDKRRQLKLPDGVKLSGITDLNR